mgnify:CR=1 FL=1
MNTKETSYNEYISRINKEKIPCYEPSLNSKEIINLSSVIKSGWLSEKKFTRTFEKQISKICQRKYSIAFTNATSALIVGMKSLNIGKGDEVIVPSFTHSADPNSISAAGAIPKFAEVDINSMCLDLSTIKKNVSKKTKAVLYVAVYGNANELDKIEKYCRKNKIYLIVDAAAALCSTYKNKPISSYGIFAVHSFFADKTITTGEGGMLLTNNEKLSQVCNLYKHDGRKERGVDKIEKAGLNCRFTELQAAVGVAQFSKLNLFVKKKIQVYHYYKKLLSKLNDIKVFDYSNQCRAVPHRVVIFTNKKSSNLIKYLSQNGIGVRTLFMPMNRQPAYNIMKKYKNSEYLFNHGICLPSAPVLKKKEIKYVCEKIIKFYEKNK